MSSGSETVNGKRARRAFTVKREAWIPKSALQWMAALRGDRQSGRRPITLQVLFVVAIRAGVISIDEADREEEGADADLNAEYAAVAEFSRSQSVMRPQTGILYPSLDRITASAGEMRAEDAYGVATGGAAGEGTFTGKRW